MYQVDCLQRLHAISESFHVVIHGLVVPSGGYQVVGDEERVHGIVGYPFLIMACRPSRTCIVPPSLVT